MRNKKILEDWVYKAIKANSGSATIVEVAKYIWSQYQTELANSGDLFFTWQYDMRWAAQNLRKAGICGLVSKSPVNEWTIIKDRQ